MALCDNPKCSRCRTQPERGCSAFERVVGVDDDLEAAPPAAYRFAPGRESWKI